MKKDFFTQDYTQGQLNAFVKKLAEQSGYGDVVERTLRNELTFSVVEKPYTEKDGRIYFSITALGLTAEEEQIRAKEKGHTLSKWAKNVLSQPDYNEKHRAVPGKVYNMVLIRGKEIQEDSERTTQSLKAIALKDFGEKSVSGLKAEFTFRIREKFSNKELEEMGLSYIAVLHEPIIDSDGGPDVLYSSRYDGESWVGADYDNPGSRWNGVGAFAFLQVSTQN